MKKRPIRLIFIYLILALLMGAISYFRALDTYELILLDLRFKSRPIQKVNPQIAIVEIGNDTLANLGQWPLPRDYHASLIKILADCGVKAIIFDMLFSEPAKHDELLVEASKQADCVYFPYAFHIKEKKDGLWQAERFTAQLLPALKDIAKGTGHANILADIDGKRRRIPLFINYRGQLLPQLSLKVASDYLDIKPEEINILPRRFVQLGKVLRIPIDEETAALVNLAGGWKDTFLHYSYSELLLAYAESAQGQSLPPLLAQLKDKVCFVGLTATGTADLNATALEPVYPNIGLHANFFNSVVTNSFLKRLSRLTNLGILYLLCLVAILLTLKTKPLLGILLQFFLWGLFIGAGFLLFIFAGLWIDLFFPITTCIAVYLGTNLFRYIKELRRSELLEKELSIARNIQRSFLREVPQELRAIDIAVAMDTARYVGGDLYDFIQFSDGRLGLMVGDVSGKGVPAALFMAQVISQFRYFASISFSPSETLTKLNQDISRQAKSALFVTMAYLIFNPANLKISFVSAGHLPPLVFRNLQLYEKLEVSEGIPLGLMEDASFQQREFKLFQGDLILLYTDGVTEARDKKGKEFGEQGILQALKDRPNLSSRQTIQILQHSINTFVGRACQHDDITMMALKVV